MSEGPSAAGSTAKKFISLGLILNCVSAPIWVISRLDKLRDYMISSFGFTGTSALLSIAVRSSGSSYYK